jgi:uncharacterized membrane protein YccC
MKRQASRKERQNGRRRVLHRYTRARILPWFMALQYAWRSAVKFDRSQLTVIRALLSAVGVVIPLAFGVATGHILEGVVMASGAVGLGAVGLTNPYHVRLKTMLLASLGVVVSAFIGGATGRIDWLAILMAGIWGVGAGLFVAIGQTAMIVGLQSTVALIIFAHFSLTPVQAFIEAMLMFAGALLQILLAMIPIPRQRFVPERAALANVYLALAKYAEDAASQTASHQTNDALVKAESTLAGGNSQRQQGRVFYGLLEEAEHIQLELMVLMAVRKCLRADNQDRADDIQLLDRIIGVTAIALREIAYELTHTRILPGIADTYSQIERATTELRELNTVGCGGNTVQQTLLSCAALCEQLRNANELANSWQRVRRGVPVNVTLLQQRELQLQNPVEVLWANLTLRSTAFRHAIRLGIVLAVATALYLVFPLQRGYWIPLTALLILKPDFSTTYSRGAARTAGTMLGALLTTILVAVFSPTNSTLVVLVGIVAFIAFSILNANYALFSAFVTAEAVLLIAFFDPHPLDTVIYRTIDTAIGGMLALIAYALWPTWEHQQVASKVAARLEAVRIYFIAVMEAYARPSAYDASAIAHRRWEGRLARSNAEASVERALSEPERYRIDEEIVRGLLVSANHVAKSIVALEAYLMTTPSRQPLPELTSFTNEVDAVLQSLVTIVRADRVSAAFPDLDKVRYSFEQLKHMESNDYNETRIFVLSEFEHIISGIACMIRLLSIRYGNSESGTESLLFAPPERFSYNLP